MKNHCLRALLVMVLSIYVSGIRVEKGMVVVQAEEEGKEEEKEAPIPKGCDCGVSLEGVSLDPMCGAEGRCRSRDDAQSVCNALNKRLPSAAHSFFAYASKKSRCSATGFIWCCKKIEKSKVGRIKERTQENLDIFKCWILETQKHVDDAMVALQEKIEEGNKTGRTSDANIKAAQALAAQCTELTSHFSKAMEGCAVSGKDDIESGCAHYRMWAIVSRDYANKILVIIGQVKDVVTYMLWGSELKSATDYLWSGGRELLFGRFLTHTVGGPVTKVFKTLWKHRMTIVIGFSIASHALPLASILTSTITMTTVSQGYSVVFSTLLRNVFWRLVCPAIHNPAIMGFVIQWVVQKVILSDALLEIINTFMLPVTGTVEATRLLQAMVRGVEYKSLTQSFAAGLKDIHKDHGMLTWAIWTMLWTVVSHMWSILGRVVCTAGGGISDAMTLVENGAEAATRHAGQSVWNLTSWTTRNVKDLLGGSTAVQSEAEGLISSMRTLEGEIPKVSQFLLHATKGLQKLHTVYAPAMQMTSSAVTGLLDLLSVNSAVGAITVKWLAGRVSEYMKNRDRSVDVESLIKTIELEQGAFEETQGDIASMDPTESKCDMNCLFDRGRLTAAETGARKTMAEVKGAKMIDIPLVEMPPDGAIEMPEFKSLTR